MLDSLREHSRPPSSHKSKQSWSQIPSGIDGITTVEPQSSTNNKHHQTDNDGSHAFVGRIVVFITDSKDAANKQSSPKHLGR